jgi:hypothetical protein
MCLLGFCIRSAYPAFYASVVVPSAMRGALLLALVVGACRKEPTRPAQLDCTVRLPSGCWTQLGRDGQWVTAIASTEWGLYVGTHDDGVFWLDPSSNHWLPLGLDHAIVSSIVFVPGATKRLLVGVMPYADETTAAAIFASEDGGLSWKPWDGGLAAEHGNRAWASSLAVDPVNPDRLYMGQSAPILRSDDGGRSWSYVWLNADMFGGGVSAIVASRHGDGRVWAAGHTAFFTAFVLRSSDWGESWEFIDPTPRVENDVSALAEDVDAPLRLWAGMGGMQGAVMRSDDGGVTWVWSLRTGWVFGLTTLSGVVYAVSTENFRPPPDGQGPPLSDLGFYRTLNGGMSWDTLPVPAGARGAQAVTADRGGGLLIGTRGSGVWRVSP